jgi:hypothetical protein
VPKKYVGALIGALVLAVAGSGLALAKVGKGPNHKFDLTFTTKKPGKAAGIKNLLSDRYAFKPQAPGQPADPASAITFTLPKGTKLDFATIPASKLKPCTVRKLGSSGDPVAAGCKRIGKGVATAVVTGLPNPITITEDAQLFAATKQIVLRLRQRPGQLGQTANIPIDAKSGGRLVAGVPKFCAADNASTPFCDTEVVLTVVKASISKVTRGKHSLLTTPKTCPKSHHWTSTVAYKFRSTKPEKVKSTSPCTK